MSLTIRPKGGLCNKLRFTFSYYYEAKRLNKHLVVLWEVSRECPGFFLDYFEPVDGITFVKNNNDDINITKIDYTGCTWCKNFNPSTVFVYSELKPLPSLISKIINNISILNNDYIAVHVRRTDHVGLAKKHNAYTDDEEMFNFINKYNKNLYIATDNKDTQDLFYNKYNHQIKILNPIKKSSSLRKTSLEDAIIDLYMCCYATDFKGSDFSSFSGFILQMRKRYMSFSV